MNAGSRAVLALTLCCLAFTAQAQHRFTTEAFISLDRMPLTVADFTGTQDTWRRLGFLLKPGPTGARDSISQIKFEDGSGIDLLPLSRTSNDDVRDSAEGPTSFSFHVHDMSAFRAALRQTRLRFDSDTRTFERLGLDYLQFGGDSRAANDRAWLAHPNGATAMSRVWLAPPRGDARNLQRVFETLGAEVTSARVYAPEGVQAAVATVGNGEVLILPPAHQVIDERPIVGATFEVRNLDTLRRWLTSMGIPFRTGGAQDASVVVAPDATQGLWLEFRE